MSLTLGKEMSNQQKFKQRFLRRKLLAAEEAEGQPCMCTEQETGGHWGSELDLVKSGATAIWEGFLEMFTSNEGEPDEGLSSS